MNSTLNIKSYLNNGSDTKDNKFTYSPQDTIVIKFLTINDKITAVPFVNGNSISDSIVSDVASIEFTIG